MNLTEDYANRPMVASQIIGISVVKDRPEK